MKVRKLKGGWEFLTYQCLIQRGDYYIDSKDKVQLAGAYIKGMGDLIILNLRQPNRLTHEPELI